eukprot:734602-Rhodomonas_salina.1
MTATVTRDDSNDRSAPARAPAPTQGNRGRSGGDNSGSSAPARVPAPTQGSSSRSEGDSSCKRAPARAPAPTQDSSSRSAPARAPAPRSGTDPLAAQTRQVRAQREQDRPPAGMPSLIHENTLPQAAPTGTTPTNLEAKKRFTEK